MPPEARAPTEKKIWSRDDSNCSIQQPGHCNQRRTAKRSMEDGATKMLNHAALQIFLAGQKQLSKKSYLKLCHIYEGIQTGTGSRDNHCRGKETIWQCASSGCPNLEESLALN
jgi:hypothetical protein